MPLMTWDGKLLLGPPGINNKLADNIACCCDDCPACCTKISGGGFNENGDIIYNLTAGGETTCTPSEDLGPLECMSVVVVMPTKNSRVICNNQNITVQFTYSSSESIPSGYCPGGFACWGPSWIFQGQSPAVQAEPDGYTNENGWVDWGCDDEAEDILEYEVTLKFNHCYTNYLEFPILSEICLQFNAADPSLEAFINFTACPNSVMCCEYDTACSPCCVKVFINDEITGGGEFSQEQTDELVFWDYAPDGVRAIKVVVKMPRVRDRTVCSKQPQPPNLQDEITVKAYYIGLDANDQLTNPPEMNIEWGEYWCSLDDEQPPVPSASPGDPGSKDGICSGYVYWGDAIVPFYSVRLKLDMCLSDNDEQTYSNALGVLIEISTDIVGLGLTVPFILCAGTDDDTCCPPCNCIDCYFYQQDIEGVGPNLPDNIRNFKVYKDGILYSEVAHNDPFKVWQSALPGDGPLGEDICQWWANDTKQNASIEFLIRYDGNGDFYVSCGEEDIIAPIDYRFDFTDSIGEGLCEGSISKDGLTDTNGNFPPGTVFKVEFDVIQGDSC